MRHKKYVAAIVGAAIVVGVGFSNCSGYKSADVDSEGVQITNVPDLTRIKYTVSMGYAVTPYPTPTLDMLYANGRVNAVLDYGPCDLNATLDTPTFERLLTQLRTAPRVTGTVSVADTGDPNVVISDESVAPPVSTQIYLDGRTGAMDDGGVAHKQIHNVMNRMQLFCGNVIESISYDRSSVAQGISLTFTFTLTGVNPPTTPPDVHVSGSIWTASPNCSKTFTNVPLPDTVKNAFANSQLGARTSLCMNPPAGTAKVVAAFVDQRRIMIDLNCSDPVGVTNLQPLYDAINAWLATQSGVCIANPVFKD